MKGKEIVERKTGRKARGERGESEEDKKRRGKKEMQVEGKRKGRKEKE